MGFNLQRITQINTQEFSAVNLLYLVKGHWNNNKRGIGSSKDKFLKRFVEKVRFEPGMKQ